MNSGTIDVNDEFCIEADSDESNSSIESHASTVKSTESTPLESGLFMKWKILKRIENSFFVHMLQ